jgi:hypothetical protein
MSAAAIVGFRKFRLPPYTVGRRMAPQPLECDRSSEPPCREIGTIKRRAAASM